MPYRKRANKTKGLSQTQKKSVATIAKRVVHREAETKSAINSLSQAVAGDSVYAQNINFFLAQGDTSESIDGEKFMLKNIYMKASIIKHNNSTATNEDLTFRVMLIRTKKALTNTSTIITYSDVFRGSSDRLASKGFVDLHKVDLLYDKTFHFSQPNQANTFAQKAITINKKINKNLLFDTDNGGYLKDKNYYLIYTAHTPNNTVETVATLRAQWALNFKDL